jgi:hypothetical protein
MAAPTFLESTAAHLRALELFREDFLGRFPDGVVISELEYLGATTIAPLRPGTLHYLGKPAVNRILDALTADFRRWNRTGDYRKPDGLGISGDGWLGELTEVTTVGHKQAAVIQLRDKLDTLTTTVNRIHNLSTFWKASPWRPTGADLLYPLPSPGGGPRFISYHPTYREHAPDGVILYEVIGQDPRRVPVPGPAAERLRERDPAAGMESVRVWALRFAQDHPGVVTALRDLVVAFGVAVVVAAVVVILAPAPPAAVVAGLAALALVTFAVRGKVGPEFEA